MSSADERSPKRQRRSYSPASPPTSAPTEHSKSGIEHQPQTPPPSVRMSPSWSQQPLPGLGMQPGGGSSASGSVTFPTPPSTAGFQSQMAGRGGSSESGGGESGQETPTVTSPEMENSGKRDGDGDAVMAEPQAQPIESGGREADDGGMVEDAEHRRSDHERQEEKASKGVEVAALPTAAPGGNVLYKLSSEPLPLLRPQPAQNILSLYDLTRMQASVARRDPNTGEKINPIRKSYAGKLKDLGLDGKNKATKNQDELAGLLLPDWSMDIGGGKTVWQDQRADALLGEHDSEQMLSMLDRALDMRPGRLPKAEHDKWQSILGLDEASIAVAAVAPGKQTNASATPAAFSPGTTNTGMAPRTAATNLLSKTAPMRNSAPASPRSNIAARPERAGKKRRYDESSYEGYDDDGYSTGGMDDTGRRGSSGGKRQKRKVSGRQDGLYSRFAVPQF